MLFSRCQNSFQVTQPAPATSDSKAESLNQKQSHNRETTKLDARGSLKSLLHTYFFYFILLIIPSKRK